MIVPTLQRPVSFKTPGRSRSVQTVRESAAYLHTADARAGPRGTFPRDLLDTCQLIAHHRFAEDHIGTGTFLPGCGRSHAGASERSEDWPADILSFSSMATLTLTAAPVLKVLLELARWFRRFLRLSQVHKTEWKASQLERQTPSRS